MPPTRTQGWIGHHLQRNETKPLQVSLRPASVDRTVSVTPVMGCAVPVKLVSDPSRSCRASYGCFTKIPLAVIMGHELGPVTKGHRAR